MTGPLRRHLLLAALAAALGGGSPALAATAPSVAVQQAWAPATPGASREGALYLTLDAAASDRLASVSTPVAGMAMLHETREVGGVSQMRELSGLALPAGQPVAMRPGGVHVMLMDLTHPLKPGERFPVTLGFDHAPPVTVTATVARPGASSP